MSTMSSSPSSPASPPPPSTVDSTQVEAAPAEAPDDAESLFWEIITGAQSHPNFDQELTLSNFQPTIDTNSILPENMPPYSWFASPSHHVTVGTRQDGTPFPLSKPILRDDGLLLVGTEIVTDSPRPHREKNRIFMANFLVPSDTTHSPSHVEVEQEVRDIHWIDSQAAIVAIGNDIQLIQLGDTTVGGPCRVQDPISSVHSDAIRELAVSRTTPSHVVSGGFDETVVVTDLRDGGDPRSMGKFNAHDVVSSVRWSPTDASHLSWTTDGGDFQVADSRVPSPQLQVPLHEYLDVDKLGGLFAHEYLSNSTVALGFESGYVAMLDLRQPRHSDYTSLESKLTAVGEIRRSGSKLAIFGRSGFSTAALDDDKMEHLTLRQQPTEIAATSYKASGDFSFESGAHLAVSDNMGIVSVYTDSTIFGSGSGGW